MITEEQKELDNLLVPLHKAEAQMDRALRKGTRNPFSTKHKKAFWRASARHDRHANMLNEASGMEDHEDAADHEEAMLEAIIKGDASNVFKFGTAASFPKTPPLKPSNPHAVLFDKSVTSAEDALDRLSEIKDSLSGRNVKPFRTTD